MVPNVIQDKNWSPYSGRQTGPTPASHSPFWPHLLFLLFALSFFSLSSHTGLPAIPPTHQTHCSGPLHLLFLSLEHLFPHIAIWMRFSVFAQMTLRHSLTILFYFAINFSTPHASLLALLLPQHLSWSNILHNLLILFIVSFPTLVGKVLENRDFCLFSLLWYSSHRTVCVIYWFSLKISWKTEWLTEWVNARKKRKEGKEGKEQKERRKERKEETCSKQCNNQYGIASVINQICLAWKPIPFY